MRRRTGVGRALLAIVVFAIPSLAASYSLELKPETTNIQFTLSDAIHTVHGTFQLKSGNIRFDTDTGKASGQITVDVASGNSGSEARDSRMHANVLESKKYPEAIFIPARVEGVPAVPGKSSLRIFGVFTIHGAAHEMTMDVQTTSTTDQLHATMGFDIPYVTWGMKDPSNFLLKVSKTVRITIDAAGPLNRY